MSRRRFLGAAAAAGAVGGAALSAADAQTAKVTKEALRPIVDAGDLAITDPQLEKLAPAVEWSRGEMRKLRDVDAGLGGPAPVFVPAAPVPEGPAPR
jgi:hypothetical protein